ncbi:hypothetical protein OPIT5_20715 [Opitutaceae bacterium TAV5]|nr:hypothetical protein OPIT5_20715 [Opitutaceae bacterium TAV5]
MPDSPLSLRAFSRLLGLSRTTVSEALRGSPRVKSATARRILEAAREAGYRHNPLAGALMSEMRRSRSGTFRGVIALLDPDGPAGRPPGSARFHGELARGASLRAGELGFKTELFSPGLGRNRLSLRRLGEVFLARGIRGLFILPVREEPDLSALDWSRFSGLYADHVIARPALHTLCSDHHRALFLALDRLHALGYRRPGLVLHRSHDARLLHRWEAAGRIWPAYYGGTRRKPSPLILDRPEQAAFTRWFRATRPDVVLGHDPVLLRWMTAAGAHVPQTHGFCCLNLTNSEQPCAGLDLQPATLGARGIELLAGQLLRNDCGIPATASATLLPARWVDGPTVRAPQSD